MHAHMPLIITLAAALGLALVLGFVAVRARLPALVGYLLAGVLLGPYTPGFVADVPLAQQLAEIGVMLLMFGVGLHFSIDDLMSVRKDRACRAPWCRWWWPPRWAPALAPVVGLERRRRGGVRRLRCRWPARWCCCARSSRAALLDSHNGRIAVGWLVVEDLAMVLVLVLLPVLVGMLDGSAAARRHRIDLDHAGQDAAGGVGLRRADAGGRPPACCRGCCGRSRRPARASCSRCA